MKSSDLPAKFLVLVYVEFGLMYEIGESKSVQQSTHGARLDLRLYSNLVMHVSTCLLKKKVNTDQQPKWLGGVRPPSPPPSQGEGGSDYKAAIMLFLKGGMDSFQMLLGCAFLHEEIFPHASCFKGGLSAIVVLPCLD